MVWNGKMKEIKLRRVHCDCEEWQIGFPQIVSAQAMSALRVASIKYTGSKFRFCPWCGKSCVEAEE
jgi:hypothetical protein